LMNVLPAGGSFKHTVLGGGKEGKKRRKQKEKKGNQLISVGFPRKKACSLGRRAPRDGGRGKKEATRARSHYQGGRKERNSVGEGEGVREKKRKRKDVTGWAYEKKKREPRACAPCAARCAAGVPGGRKRTRKRDSQPIGKGRAIAPRGEKGPCRASTEPGEEKVCPLKEKEKGRRFSNLQRKEGRAGANSGPSRKGHFDLFQH